MRPATCLLLIALTVLLTLTALLTGCAARRGIGPELDTSGELQQGAGNGAEAPQPASKGTPVPAGLPSPAAALELLPQSIRPRKTSYSPLDLRRLGNEGSPELPRLHYSSSGERGVFSPELPQGQGLKGLAVAFYPFFVGDYGGNAAFNLVWTLPPAQSQPAHLLLGNFDTNRFEAFPLSDVNLLELPSISPYIRDDGMVLIGVMVGGSTSCELAELRIGSRPPEVTLSATPRFGPPPLNVTFNASASDPDGEIVEYQWDTNGDGFFFEGTGPDPSISFNYEQPLSPIVGVRAIDNDGVYGEAFLSVNAVEHAAFSYGAAGYDVQPSVVLTTAGGDLLVAGGFEKQSSLTDFDVFVGLLRPNNKVTWFRRWVPGQDRDTISGGALAPDDSVVICGTSSSFGDSAEQGLLQRWRLSDGKLLWSIAIDDSPNLLRLNAVTVGANTIFVAGDFTQDGGKQSGYVGAFDLDGNLLWSDTVIGPEFCNLNAIGRFAPTQLGDPQLRVCGSYDHSAADTDLLYCTFSDAGSLTGAQTWGADNMLEIGSCLSIVGSGQLSTTFVGGRQIEPGGGGEASGIVGIAGGSVRLLQVNANDTRATAATSSGGKAALAFSVFDSTKTGLCLLRFDGSLGITGPLFIDAGAAGNVLSPTSLSNYGGSLVCASRLRGQAAAEGTTGAVLSDPALAWEALSPSVGHPQLAPQATAAVDLTFLDLSFNPAGLDPLSDTALYVHLGALPEQ